MDMWRLLKSTQYFLPCWVSFPSEGLSLYIYKYQLTFSPIIHISQFPCLVHKCLLVGHYPLEVLLSDHHHKQTQSVLLTDDAQNGQKPSPVLLLTSATPPSMQRSWWSLCQHTQEGQPRTGLRDRSQNLGSFSMGLSAAPELSMYVHMRAYVFLHAIEYLVRNVTFSFFFFSVQNN